MSKGKVYLVLVGFNYTPTDQDEEVRFEPGDKVTALPVHVAKTLLDQQAIEEVK